MKGYMVMTTSQKVLRKVQKGSSIVHKNAHVYFDKLLMAKKGIELMLREDKSLLRSDFEIRQFEIRSTGRSYQ